MDDEEDYVAGDWEGYGKQPNEEIPDCKQNSIIKYGSILILGVISGFAIAYIYAVYNVITHMSH